MKRHLILDEHRLDWPSIHKLLKVGDMVHVKFKDGVHEDETIELVFELVEEKHDHS